MSVYEHPTVTISLSFTSGRSLPVACVLLCGKKDSVIDCSSLDKGGNQCWIDVVSFSGRRQVSAP
jgi:hypothetical protein